MIARIWHGWTAPENADAYEAWLFKLKPSQPAQLESLLDAGAYQKIADADKH